MPIYEYECSECGRFEVVQKVSEEPLNKDPDCTRANCPCKAQRVISATAFHLKGSGWYKTDYTSSSSSAGSSKSSATSPSATSTESPAEAKSESSADSAPAEKKTLKTTGGGGGCGSGCGCH